ncbi:EamA-like transporter family protein [Rhodothalassium salexigens DSM 2132]|uniref:EamA-like transporter family protein n=2 Tax=Rhodothalassium salexigens TaxID=1086 RepID=A0A4R2PIQ3_RHOSA|nr:DMT family transporter [Rhodothalassium salexigens]MBB4211265.1 drug/metabolite transporter (DMT)-like permease [Rhodothalassium salexigens DSM 2132]MBK5921445.1 hypothetical protein [Rhodothalassium salexigens]TCP35187.1 EamA-like transporter family protein [Rhodothalassium salexigens DSM 2132]
MTDRSAAAPAPETATAPTAEPGARLALPLLLAGAVGIGFAPIFVRLASEAGVDPVASAFWRMALATPLLGLSAAWVARANAARRGPPPDGALPAPGHRRGLVFMIAAGLFFAADLSLWHWSITLTSVANATLLTNLSTVFVPLFGFFVLGQRFRGSYLAGVVLALGGAALLVGLSLDLGGTRPLGDLLGVATAVMYTGYFLSTAAARRYVSTPVTVLAVTGGAALALLPVAILSGDNFWPTSAIGWAPLIGVALISQVAGQGLIIFAVRHLPPAFTVVSLLIQPLVAALVAWVLFGEALGPVELAGGAMVLMGILLARRGAR